MQNYTLFFNSSISIAIINKKNNVEILGGIIFFLDKQDFLRLVF